MTHTLPLASTLARHPKLVAAAIGLAMLLLAEPIHAAGRGSAQNPILLPGTETSSARSPVTIPRDRVILRRGAFEATLYALPAASLLPGLTPRLAHDASVLDAVARTRLDAGEAGTYDVGATGLRLSVDPAWDVEIDGHDIEHGEIGDPTVLARTRAVYRTTQVGLEVRF